MVEKINSGGLDACQIGESVQSAEYLQNSSVSASTQYKIILKEDIFQSGGKSAILKIWSFLGQEGNVCQLEQVDKKYISDIQIRLLALDYERWIYKHIIRRLIDENICPNFVAFYSSGKRCSFDQIKKIIKEENFRDQILKRTCRGPGGVVMDPDKLASIDITKIDFGVLITEFVEKSLADIVVDILENKETMNEELWKILFQICYATYVLSNAGVSHNDLHLGNIRCDDLKESKTLTYIVETDEYKFETRFIPKIFDFDRSYSKRVNVTNPYDGIKGIGIGNFKGVVENWDFMYFLGWFLKGIVSQFDEREKKAESEDKSEDKTFWSGKKEYWLKGCEDITSFKFDGISEVDDDVYEYQKWFQTIVLKIINSPEEILRKIAKKMGERPIGESKNVYIFSKSMFDSNTGGIRLGNVLEVSRKEKRKLEEVRRKEKRKIRADKIKIGIGAAAIGAAFGGGVVAVASNS